MIYTIANHKGGVGKSSTAAALTAGLVARGYKALAIDLDSQRNLSFSMGADCSKPSSLGLLLQEVAAEDAIQHTAHGDLIPASKNLAGADAFISETGKEYRLKEALAPVLALYDFIVIDTPPALGITTVNALTACDSVIIPAQADVFSIQGIRELIQTMEPVKKYCNHDLTIAGVLLTRYSPRSVLSREVADMIRDLAASAGTQLFTSTIREAVSVKEAQMMQTNIFDYAPAAKVTGDYNSFIDELLSGRKE